MPLTRNEIRIRATEFARKFRDASSEIADAHTFWDAFFDVFGISRYRMASFEANVQRHIGAQRRGRVDCLWKGLLLIEHKSKDEDLDLAYDQALEYLDGLSENELPRYIIVSDFQRIRLIDLEKRTKKEIRLEELPIQANMFDFIAGYEHREIREENPLNIKAAYLMGKLFDELVKEGYDRHQMGIYLMRLLFCMFADDTGIFEKDQLVDYIELQTRPDGSDLGGQLHQIFEILGTPKESRQSHIDENLASLEYVDGRLFEGGLPVAAFDSASRKLLLECFRFDWSSISPAIFGSMFQAAMDPALRENIGAYYTSEKNIMKVIHDLFLDDLRNEFEKCGRNKIKLEAFQHKLSALKFLDPACGCGNFLVISYREIRKLELEVLKLLYPDTDGMRQGMLDARAQSKVFIDQMYGIEIEDFPCHIAEVALYLTDHQMNLELSRAFGTYYARLPLMRSPNIKHGNALSIDWSEIVSKEQLSYILGNPPFISKNDRSSEQNEDMKRVFGASVSSGVLDYVTAWYAKAANWIQGTGIKVAFVSTNSITQGEQVGVLWTYLFARHIKIHFAHRSFRWFNEAHGNASVHVVIIGFAAFDIERKSLHDYLDPNGDPSSLTVNNINPYLFDFEDVVVTTRHRPLCSVPGMVYGSKPTDHGQLLLTDEEKDQLLASEPGAAPYVKRFISAKEFISNEKRWCLWLVDIEPQALNRLPKILERVENVKRYRLTSKKKQTKELANYPNLFAERRQPITDYILIPRHSSEDREYIPMGFFGPDFIVADSCSSVPGANLFHFGVLESAMHMAWVRQVCGRIKSDYRYSNNLVYNNFPWPVALTEAQAKLVEKCATEVLGARGAHPGAALKDLYKSSTMPEDLRKAHKALDAAVDRCYGNRKFSSELSRLELLFSMYKKLASTAGVEVETGTEEED